jgi:hypothetical protein
VKQNKPPYSVNMRLVGADTIVLHAQPAAQLVQQPGFGRRTAGAGGFWRHGVASGGREMDRFMELVSCLDIYKGYPLSSTNPNSQYGFGIHTADLRGERQTRFAERRQPSGGSRFEPSENLVLSSTRPPSNWWS